VWPKGVTLAAEAAFIVIAEAASAAAPVSILRRSKPPLFCSGSGKVSGVVMISSHGFLFGRAIVCLQSGIKRADDDERPVIRRVWIRGWCQKNAARNDRMDGGSSDAR